MGFDRGTTDVHEVDQDAITVSVYDVQATFGSEKKYLSLEE